MGTPEPEPPAKRAEALECELCKRYAVTGGPPHTPSPRCESGKRPHCSCDICF